MTDGTKPGDLEQARWAVDFRHPLVEGQGFSPGRGGVNLTVMKTSLPPSLSRPSRRALRPRFAPLAVSAAALLACSSASAVAATYTWDGTANLWTSAHWDAGAGLVTGPVGASNAHSAIINAGTVTFAGNDTFGNAGTAASPIITINAGGTLASGGTFNTMWNLTLNGGTLLANGGVNSPYGAFGLKGTVTIGGSAASNISVGAGSNNTVSLGTSTAGGFTTFDVADVTVSTATDLTVATVLNNNSNAASGLVKAGAGTMFLGAANTYSGGTTLNAGTIQIGNALGLGAVAGLLAVNGGTLDLNTFNVTTGALSGTGGTITKTAAGVTTYTTITAANSSYAGTLSNGAGTLNLTKSGAGTLTLTGAGSTLGDVTVNGGGGLTFGTGASLTTLATSRLLLGLSAGVSGTMTVDTGGPAVTFGGSPFNLANYVGVDGGTGTLNVNSGVLNLTGMASGGGHLHVGANGGVSNGTVTVAGGTMNVGTRMTMGVGYPGSDAINVVGNNANGNATLTISSGAVNIGTGSGADTDRGALYLKSPTGGTGTATVNLNGGTLSLNRFQVGTGGTAKTVKFNGGTVQARATTATFLEAAGNLSTVVSTGGARFDTNGFDVTVNSPLTHDAALGATPDGGLTKIGNGMLTLPAAQTFTGNIAVNGGTLALRAGSYAGGLALANNTRLASVTNLVGTLTVPTLTLGTGTTLDFHFGVGNDLITISNANGLALGSTAINLFQDGNTLSYAAAGTYTLLDYNTAFSGSVGSFSIANPVAGKGYAFTDDTVGTTIQLTITNLASQWIATGGGFWTDAANWTASGVPNGVGAAVEFNTSIVGPALVTVNGPKTAGGIAFNNTTDGYTISGTGSDPITLNTGTASPATISVLGTHTIAAPLVLASDLSATVAGGSSLAVSGDVSGAKAITVSGGGTVILSGTNSFTTTMISSSTLQVGSGGTTGTLGSGAVTNNGTLALNRSDDFTITNDISGTGGVSKTGANKVTLAGVNSFTGAISATGGTLVLGSLAGTAAVTLDGATLNTTSAISTARPITIGSGGATIEVAASTALTASGVITGGGGLAKTGNGTLTLAGANTATGLVSVNVGILAFGGAGTLGAAASIAVATGATLRFDRNDTFGNHATAVSQAITVNGGTIANGGNFFTTLGAVTLNAGTINSIGGANASFPSFSLRGPVTVGGSAASTISGSGANSQMVVGGNTAGSQTTFDVADATGDSAADLTVSVPLQNNRSGGFAEIATGIVKTGAGTMVLTGANSYTGGTTIDGGILNVNADTALGGGAGAVAISNGATLQAGGPLTSSRTFTLGTGGGQIDTAGSTVALSGPITGASDGLTKTGNGTLTLTGTQSYTTLTANGGAASVTNLNSALGTGASTINANATLNINASQTLAALNIAAGVEVTFGDGMAFAGGPEKFSTVGVVPEPGSATLLLGGAALLGLRRRRA